jgi:hypothetical protein
MREERGRMVNLLIPGRGLDRALIPALLTGFIPGHFGRDVGLVGSHRILTTASGAGIPDVVPVSCSKNYLFF